jgi:hypothetical protein
MISIVFVSLIIHEFDKNLNCKNVVAYDRLKTHSLTWHDMADLL